jgi:hypothetical protein
VTSGRVPLSKAPQQRVAATHHWFARFRDVVLYVAIAVVVYAAVVLSAFLYPKTPGYVAGKWLGFAGVTALVFGETIRLNRRRWGEARFWVFLASFFGAQCGLGIAVLSMVTTQFSTLVWGFLFPLNYAVLSAYLAYFLESKRN